MDDPFHQPGTDSRLEPSPRPSITEADAIAATDATLPSTFERHRPTDKNVFDNCRSERQNLRTFVTKRC